MQELIQIRIEELSRLRDELIEKQKKDLRRIEVRIEELKVLSSSAHVEAYDAVPIEIELPFHTEGHMELEDAPPPKVESPKVETVIPPILKNVVVASEPVVTASGPIGQDDIEALINGLV